MPESWSATPKTPKLPLIARISLIEKCAPERVKISLFLYIVEGIFLLPSIYYNAAVEVLKHGIMC